MCDDDNGIKKDENVCDDSVSRVEGQVEETYMSPPRWGVNLPKPATKRCIALHIYILWVGVGNETIRVGRSPRVSRFLEFLTIFGYLST